MKYKNYLGKLIFPLEPKKFLEQRGSNIYERGIHFNAPAVAADRYVVVGQHVTRWASATTENFGGKPPCHRRSPSEYPRGYAPKGLLIRLLQTNQNKQKQTKPSKPNKKPNKAKQTDRQTDKQNAHQKKQTRNSRWVSLSFLVSQHPKAMTFKDVDTSAFIGIREGLTMPESGWKVQMSNGKKTLVGWVI